MFNFFKKNRGLDFAKRKELVEKVVLLLQPEFNSIKSQLEEGLLVNFTRLDFPFVNYTKFLLKTDILNKYESKNEKYFSIKGVKVFDNNLQNYTDIHLYLAYGLLLGYSTPFVKELDPDVKKINTSGYWLKSFENDEYDEIKNLFTSDELKLLNANDIYKIQLNGKEFYHLCDLQDGDFIAMDLSKKVYLITHDPFEISLVEKSIFEILSPKV